jgi:hypothetical protein
MFGRIHAAKLSNSGIASWALCELLGQPVGAAAIEGAGSGAEMADEALELAAYEFGAD